MVYLVLQTDTHEAIEPLCEFGAVAVERRDFNNLGPLNGLVKSGHRQTPLVIVAQRLIDDGDLGVNKDSGIRVVLTEVHDNHALVDIDLTGCQANAGRVIHGLEHVIDKLLNPCIYRDNRYRERAQSRVGKLKNRE